MGGFHGWLTNWLAVRLLFRPRRPWRVLGITIQGVLPRRREDLIRSIAAAVEREFLSGPRLLDLVNTPAIVERLETATVGHVRLRIGELLPGFIPGALRERIMGAVAEAVAREVVPWAERVLHEAQGAALPEGAIAALVEERLDAYDEDELEAMIVRLAGRELRFIEFFGLAMGLVIGLIQGLIVFVLE